MVKMGELILGFVGRFSFIKQALKMAFPNISIVGFIKSYLLAPAPSHQNELK